MFNLRKLGSLRSLTYIFAWGVETTNQRVTALDWLFRPLFRKANELEGWWNDLSSRVLGKLFLDKFFPVG